jgi:hypothetical protein
VTSETAETEPIQRDYHLRLIATKGMEWQNVSKYNKCTGVEAAIGRDK